MHLAHSTRQSTADFLTTLGLTRTANRVPGNKCAGGSDGGSGQFELRGDVEGLDSRHSSTWRYVRAN